MSSVHEQRYRAIASRDARFDGMFYTAVRTTGIYCRPSCPAVTPRISNVVFYMTAAAAEAAGFRACRRCRPDTTPGSPWWNVRADAVGRAMTMIADGVVERDGVDGLARRLGYSTRHVHRLVAAELGAGPLALARSARAQTARLLIETTTLPMSDIAFASGFASIRQFNDAIRQIYHQTPTHIRASRRPSTAAAGRLQIRLAVRQPFAAEALLDFLAAHAVPGLESVVQNHYFRTLRLPHGLGAARLTLSADGVDCELELQDLRDTATAVQRCRSLLDLDADPVAIGADLGADPLLAPLVSAAPGLRVPGSANGFETAVRTIVGQQVSVSGANTVTARIVAQWGTAFLGDGGLTHAFPSPADLAGVDPTTLPMPRTRAAALVGLAAASADGQIDLEPGADRDQTRAALLSLPGIGPWTADYIVMRALSHPDVLLDTDLVLRRELAARGIDREHADRWRPWRSYAGMHLWRASASTERMTA